MLLVDDHPAMETAIRTIFRPLDVEIVVAPAAERALELARRAAPQLAIVDIYFAEAPQDST